MTTLREILNTDLAGEMSNPDDYAYRLGFEAGVLALSERIYAWAYGQDCEKCGGSGHGTRSTGDFDSECPTCGGTGKVRGAPVGQDPAQMTLFQTGSGETTA